MHAKRFIASILDLKPQVAVFDCDGTLWQGDSGDQFLFWAIKHNLISKDKSSWAMKRYRRYTAGKIAERKMWGDMVALFAGLSARKMSQAAKAFFADVMTPGIFPEMQALARNLSRSGCNLWAVSSTNEWVIRAGASYFGIRADHVLAASIAIKEGIATSKVLRVPTDDEKAAVIRKFIKRRPDVAFGNSIHDVAMLELARHAVTVNPSPDLKKIARARKWPIYRPAASSP